MKCANCGAELRTGCLYCSSCGKEAQIVPDYDAFEDDDYINSLINEQPVAKNSNKANSVNSEQKKKAELARRKRNIIISSAVVSVVLICVILIFVGITIRNKNNNSFEYQVSQAEKYFEEGNYTQAVKYYERALEIDSSNNEVKLTLADIYCLRQDEKSAIILYSEVAAADKSNIKAFSKLIELYDESKDYEAILSLMELTDDPKVMELFNPYIVSRVEFSKLAGQYDDFFDLILTCGSGCKIYYSLDDTDPKSGIVYNSPIKLDREGEYKITAIAKNEKGLYSEPVEMNYAISIAAPDIPSVSPDGGSFSQNTKVYIDVPEGCLAYYTWDSTDPTSSSTQYTGPIDVPEGNNVLSVIIIDNKTGKCSNVYRGHFELYL